MTEQLDLDAEAAVVAGAEAISGNDFGARYTAFRTFDRFEGQIEGQHIGLISWPGGWLAETKTGLLGLEYDGLYNEAPSGDRPGLDEMMEFAVENDMALSVVLPTVRYAEAHDQLRDDLSAFLHKLYSGGYGELPQQLFLEIGNEHHVVFEGADEAAQAEQYAEIVNVYADIVSQVETDYYDIDPDQVLFGVQLAHTDEANQALINALTDDAILLLSETVLHHRFPHDQDGSEWRTDEVESALEMWDQAAEALGGEGPALFLSSYNIASLTRTEAAEMFLESHPEKGLSEEDLDLDGRSNAEFEQYYQDRLAERAYGMEHAEGLLQIFSDYQEIGLEAASVYGWDNEHAARSSLTGSDGEQYIFAPGAIQGMMAESLIGTSVLDWHNDNDEEAGDVSVFGFDSADKLIVFLAAPDFDEDFYTVEIPLAGLGPVKAIWGESLTAKPPNNWLELFDIPASPGVPQDPEAETFSVAFREEYAPQVEEGIISVEFDEPTQIVRLVMARTDAGVAEISEWHGESYVEVLEDPDAEPPGVDDPDGDGGEDDLDLSDSDDAGFGSLGLMILLPLLMALGLG